MKSTKKCVCSINNDSIDDRLKPREENMGTEILLYFFSLPKVNIPNDFDDSALHLYKCNAAYAN